ncbi:hypothetical protein LV564_00015 (plasmid) [Komagataeibacter nataicola]|uniref:hypothetical protein n=1 Tax=Komagataeibacter nataicola TaxID=265960 RepID=UPI0023DD39A8|nr:hypothetical protein [Komagataeibacter nataicola]WEQ54206.1 hypothetical protein LV564_00015 [Komagataeibacter nataicola]
MAGNVHDLDSFKAFLRDRAQETWEERKIPYYLSIVATDLKGQGVNYHDFTGPLRLAQWAAKEKIAGTKLVTHPTIKAKVGFLPDTSEFDFNNPPVPSPQTIKTRPTAKQGQALVKFVESLARMPEKAMAELAIPAKVLVSLLNN